jgi:hypothetical protein
VRRLKSALAASSSSHRRQGRDRGFGSVIAGRFGSAPASANRGIIRKATLAPKRADTFDPQSARTGGLPLQCRPE